MPEGFGRHHPRGMVDPSLPEDAVAAHPVVLPFHAHLLALCAGGLSAARILARHAAHDMAADAVSAVVPRRLGSRPARKKTQGSTNRVTI